jgi:ribosomal protein S18 acetylase RimI-like enzyme
MKNRGGQVLMIAYRHSLEGVSPDQLEGFFVGWPSHPSKNAHYRLLEHSDAIVIAVDEHSERVVGFITAHTDQVLSAYIPLLEVLPDYQGRGIGRQLVRLMLDRLRDFYMVDLLCDEDLQEFYASLGMKRATGMMIRNHERQTGEKLVE